MESDFHCFDSAIKLLAGDKLAEFDASLSELSDAERQQHRTQYLHDAIEPIGPGRPFLESLESFAKSMSLIFLPLALILVFLPLFVVTRSKLAIKRATVNRRLSRALSYWDIEKRELD